MQEVKVQAELLDLSLLADVIKNLVYWPIWPMTKSNRTLPITEPQWLTRFALAWLLLRS